MKAKISIGSIQSTHRKSSYHLWQPWQNILIESWSICCYKEEGNGKSLAKSWRICCLDDKDREHVLILVSRQKRTIWREPKPKECTRFSEMLAWEIWDGAEWFHFRIFRPNDHCRQSFSNLKPYFTDLFSDFPSQKSMSSRPMMWSKRKVKLLEERMSAKNRTKLNR